MRRIVSVALISLLCSCADRNMLSERHARTTAERVVAAEHVRDFHHLEWQALETVSPGEAHATAVLVYRFQLPDGGAGEERVPGRFVYQKAPQGWTLESIEFPNPGNLDHALTQNVSVRVTSGRARDMRAPQGGSGESGGEPGAPSASSSADSGQTGPVAPLSIAAARTAAKSYVESAAPEGKHWTLKSFGQLAPAGQGAYELPATLVEDDNDGIREYSGTFFFTRAADASGTMKWMLSRMSFRAQGREPIERQANPPIEVE